MPICREARICSASFFVVPARFCGKQRDGSVDGDEYAVRGQNKPESCAGHCGERFCSRVSIHETHTDRVVVVEGDSAVFRATFVGKRPVSFVPVFPTSPGIRQHIGPTGRAHPLRRIINSRRAASLSKIYGVIALFRDSGIISGGSSAIIPVDPDGIIGGPER